jgi:5-methylthioadenosine/S-adenosylhomocysteine deaminase
MQPIDILIHAGWIIPVEPDNVIYEHHAVAIQDGNILAILPSDEAVGQFTSRDTHHLPNHLLIPGLINTHTHAAMNLLRGLADDMPLQEWLTQHIWPAEQACVSPEFVSDGTQLAMAEMLRGGVTCFSDMYFFPDVECEVVSRVGMRAMVGLILIDFPTPWGKDAEDYLRKAREVHYQYREHPLVRTALAPHAPYTVSDASLTAGEIRESLENHGERPLERLQRLKLLSSRLIAIHTTQLTEAEIQVLANTGVNVVHCPESNLKLASGFCPVHQLLKAGVNVALGTDGAASNDDLDILGEMHTAALLAKGLSQDARCLPAAQALKMATLNGAKALGINHLTGSLLPGKAADITAIDLHDVETQPLYNPLSTLVYAVGRDKVTDVWVAGKQLLKSRRLTTLDTHELLAKTQMWREKIMENGKWVVMKSG